MPKKTSAYPNKVLSLLKKRWGDAACSLNYEEPLELLIATILSAQCTDVRVNMVTPALFKKYKTAKDYAKAPIEELEAAIKSTGFFRSKAKSIIGSCKVICEKYAGTVPCDLDALVSLPGVGRKTANVVLGNAFGVTNGVVVDTHVSRLSRRLGFSNEKTPEKIEQDLMKLFPEKDWISLSHILIQLGREYCKARKPDCENCPVGSTCMKKL
ncbi:MAG: endonuclease III [Thermoguttaceae bacterium]